MSSSALLPTIQLELRPGIIELLWGHPPLDLLPVAGMQRAAMAALDHHGGEALTYGYVAGPGPLIVWLCERIGRTEGRTPDVDELLITAGNSQALDQLLTLCTQPGDTVLVESPTYHLAVRILRDHPLKLVAAPADGEGLDPAALAQILAGLHHRNIRPPLLYTVPTFHNPTGVSLSPARRQALVQLAADYGLLIVEDDVYRELAYDGPPPPSLWSLAPAQVIRLGSFAKSLAPGVRLGWLTAPRPVIARLADGGLLDSGGGVNHFTALVVNAFCHSGDYDQHVAQLRAAYTVRRDALLAALAAHLPPGCSWYRPTGGYFAWVMLPPSWRSTVLLPQAEAAGVSFLPGPRFYLNGGGENALRLAFSLYAPPLLEQGIARLGRVLAANQS